LLDASNGATSGTSSLIKAGSGTLVLTAANTYTGGTYLNAGTLQVTSSGNLGTGGLSFGGDGSALLDIEGSIAYADTRAITLGANGTILQDNTAGAMLSGVISGGGELFKTGPGNLILSNPTNAFGGTAVEAGMLTVTTIGALPSNESLVIEAGGTLVFDPQAAANGDSVTALPSGAITAVPEPGTGLLLVAFLGGAAWALGRRSRL
jgi:autotransporter-associated beta strand protein